MLHVRVIVAVCVIGIVSGCTKLSETDDSAGSSSGSNSAPSPALAPAPVVGDPQVALPLNPRPQSPDAQATRDHVEFQLQQRLQQSANTGPRSALITRIGELAGRPIARPMGLSVPLRLSGGARYLFHPDGEIKALDLRSLGLTEADVAEISKLPRLETLLLSHSSIGDEAIETLGTMKNLKWLNVSDTKFSPEGVQRLRELLPMCDVD